MLYLQSGVLRAGASGSCLVFQARHQPGVQGFSSTSSVFSHKKASGSAKLLNWQL